MNIIHKAPESDARPTPILFVHGAWNGAWVWEAHFLDYFAQNGYHAYAFDLPGHGQDQRPLQGQRVADYVKAVEDVVKTIDQAPVLVGHSMGGLVVQKYLEIHHDSPAAVLLAAVPPHGAYQTLLRYMRRSPITNLPALLRWQLHKLFKSPEDFRDEFMAAGTPTEQADGYHDLMSNESFRAVLDLLLFNLPKPEKVQTQMLVLGGDEDKLFSPKEVQSTAEAYHTGAEIFSQTGHVLMLDVKWQQVADRILGWLHALEL